MASSRQMRRPRIPSPMDTSAQENLRIKKEVQAGIKNGNKLEEWREPPLREPVPSFQDYKGLERHGVLEHMAPLGTMPSQKVKARLRHHEPARRAANLKNGEALAAREDVSTPEPVLPITMRRSEPRRTEEERSKPSSSRERDEDHPHHPKGLTIRTTPAKAVPAQPSPCEPPTPRTAASHANLKKIVDKAIERAYEQGDSVLSLALKRCYEESLHDRMMADLLNAMLTRTATTQQTAEFQGYVKAAKKQIKNSEEAQKLSSLSSSVSKSPGKSVRTIFTHHTGTSGDHAPGVKHHLSSSNHQPRRQRNNESVMPSNGSPSKDGRPSKRVKRSNSPSSDSSLSSLDSDVENFAPATLDSKLTQSANAQFSPPKSTQSSGGPRLGSFSTSRHYDPARRPNATLSAFDNETAAEFRAKRLMLDKEFQEHVRDSAIRAGPKPVRHPSPFAPCITHLSERTQQARLRNDAVHRGQQGKDDDALDSPASSQSDFLIPPPPFASRGATPDQLGRPSKAMKKAARIKTSPVKKRNGVTAGIAQSADADGHSTGYGRMESHIHENSDVCAACGGSGVLLCCDGCWRAYHCTCCDPPIDSEEPPNGQWFCYECMKTRVARPKAERGLFAGLENDITVKNPSAYNLPHPVRDYFEGVKTGDEGEYEEAIAKASGKARAGYEEVANNLKLKDINGNAVLCFRCNQSSVGRREIIQCDFCSLSWHLDCLDPPLANAPRRLDNGRPRWTWMCPNHIDHELNNIRMSDNKVESSNPLEPFTGRTYKIRRIKNAKIVDVSLRRGFKNNGLVEIENETSSEDEPEQDVGVAFRLPEKGFKLDFIARTKRAREEEAQHRAVAAAEAAAATRSQRETLETRPFAERKAALNLTQMAQCNVTLNPDKFKNLINTLTASLSIQPGKAEAPKDVENLVAAAEAVDSEEQEKRDLQAMIHWAQRRLGVEK